MMTRRQAMVGALFGMGAVGLRSLATGIPAAFLLNPRGALAAGTCVAATKAQYFVLSTSGNGDPINAGAPGTYADTRIVHSPDAAMAAMARERHRCALICDTTPPYPFRASIEAAHAIRKGQP